MVDRLADDPHTHRLAGAGDFERGFPNALFSRRRFLQLLTAALAVGPAAASSASEAALGAPGEPALLTILGILQPVDVPTIRKFIETALPELGDVTSATYIAAVLEQALNEGRIIEVRSAPPALYSLTATGNAALPRRAQIFRDKARLFLIRDRPRANVKESRGGGIAGGVPPPEWIRARIEAFVERQRPFGSRPFLADRRSGKRPLSRDTTLALLSFDNLARLNAALGGRDAAAPMTLEGLALCLGLSPGLLAWFSTKPQASYRRFSIPKRRGGERQIDSPRIYLKVTQRLLLHYFLSQLKVHDAVYS